MISNKLSTYPSVRPHTNEKSGKIKCAATPAATASATHGNTVSLATTTLSWRNWPAFNSRPPLTNMTVRAASLHNTKETTVVFFNISMEREGLTLKAL